MNATLVMIWNDLSTVLNIIMVALFTGTGLFGTGWILYQLDYLDFLDRWLDKPETGAETESDALTTVGGA